ncbi:endo-1,4-beta-xylanase [Arcticibacter tournemirensis]|uniref:Beta-xylanase n=1 Tax=Arcticibacter tournemirensis TaxID=699437 RepID=A0A5M9HAQ7_9SPHI|nr:endo-1,4-beta-xylanase [Arcticibacter tournemirensis]KAA8483419.1 endo-1,4-beta-xylanase [Arcticibacter tournemirensis]TQM50887.1 endo-1,4-beta-xylanase [Arcticibacter tournemirensis]
MRDSFILTSILSILLSAGCSSFRSPNEPKQSGTLKDTFKGNFTIGTAINADQIRERDPVCGKIITDNFDAVTPENIMKAEVIHPEWDRYDFSLSDKLVDYAKKHNLEVNGHTLIWHSQLPSFVRRMKDADSVRQYFTNHIKTVASRYDGKLESWDVVNEALEEDGSMRRSIFLEKLGDNFVVEAFKLARQASPNTKLYYNDYNIEEPAKRAGAIRLIKKIQAAGVHIDGVGIQGHWNINHIPLKHIEDAITEFSALGIKVAFTELDLSVLPSPPNATGADVNQNVQYDAKLNPYTEGLPDSVQQKLTDGYASLFRLFLKHSDKIGRITMWGVHDGQSWLNNWPVMGRTNYPLLFDRQLKPKPAFYQVLKIKENYSVNNQSHQKNARFN